MFESVSFDIWIGGAPRGALNVIDVVLHLGLSVSFPPLTVGGPVGLGPVPWTLDTPCGLAICWGLAKANELAKSCSGPLLSDGLDRRAGVSFSAVKLNFVEAFGALFAAMRAANLGLSGPSPGSDSLISRATSDSRIMASVSTA